MPIVSLATLKAYFTNGKVPNQSQYEDLIDSLGSGYLGYLGCQAYINSNQAITNNAWNTIVNWGVENFDIGDFHSTSTNPERFTVPVAGIYIATLSLNFATNGTGSRGIKIVVNSDPNDIVADSFSISSGSTFRTGLNCSGHRSLAVNDYLTCMAFQNSGGDLNLINNDIYGREFTISRIG